MTNQILVKDLLHFLNQFAPPSLAEDWDNIGLQIGSLKAKVRGVLVALDVTEAVLRELKQAKANVLITHHPLFLDSSKISTTVRTLKHLAYQNKIHILSFHTNLDSTHQGLNDLLAHQLELKSLKPLIPSRNKKYPLAGLGRLGKIPQKSFKKFLNHVCGALALQDFRFVGPLNKKVQTVAVMTGSGGDFFREAKKKGADVLVTGDVKYHQALDALAEGIALVDIGHFAGEIGMVHLLAHKIRIWAQEKQLSLKVYETQVQKDPFEFY